MASQYRMYDELVDLWTVVSEPRDYDSEAEHWRRALREKLGPGRHKLLELGIGAGDNLNHFAKEYQATGVDISEKMLEISRKQNPEVMHYRGDMRTIRLDQKFNAVIIHDAISYLTSEEDLRNTIKTAAIHLEPRGVFVIAPEWYKETYKQAAIYHVTRNQNGRSLTFIQYEIDPDKSDTTMQCLMLYLITENGKLRVEQDLHTTGIFSMKTWDKLLTEAGFQIERKPFPIYEDGREAYLLVCTWTGWFD
jgi:SAM-dependent methyltransferase